MALWAALLPVPWIGWPLALGRTEVVFCYLYGWFHMRTMSKLVAADEQLLLYGCSRLPLSVVFWRMQMRLKLGSCAWALAFLSLCVGCGEGDGQVCESVADAADGKVDSGVGEVTSPEPGPEVVELVPAEEVTGDPTEEPYEEDEECHYDCFGGGYCTSGTMVYLGYGPAPCDHQWGPWGVCVADNEPCISGVCGDVEFCQDDIDALESLVPESGTWQEAFLATSVLEEDGYRYGTPSRGDWGGWPCYWRFQLEEGVDNPILFEMRALGLDTYLGTEVAGTTSLMTSELPLEKIAGVWVDGVPADPSLVSLYWLSGSDIGYSTTQGVSGAVVMTGPDGTVTTVVWLAQTSGAFRLGIHTLPAEATPEEPGASRR